MEGGEGDALPTGSRVNCSECKRHGFVYFVLSSQYQQVERTVSRKGDRKKASPVL